jgi:hypothetical protein
MRPRPHLVGIRLASGEAAIEIARPVTCDAQAGGLHPSGDEIMPRLLGLTQAWAVGSLPASDRVQLCQLLVDVNGRGAGQCGPVWICTRSTLHRRSEGVR